MKGSCSRVPSAEAEDELSRVPYVKVTERVDLKESFWAEDLGIGIVLWIPHHSP